MILDGWGIGKHDKGDVIFKTPTPYLDYLTAVSAHSTLQTCGEDVGLPKGQMGNSEVGHLNIGAGRGEDQDLVKYMVLFCKFIQIFCIFCRYRTLRVCFGLSCFSIC